MKYLRNNFLLNFQHFIRMSVYEISMVVFNFIKVAVTNLQSYETLTPCGHFLGNLTLNNQ